MRGYLKEQAQGLRVFFSSSFRRHLRNTAFAFAFLTVGSYLLGRLMPQQAENVVTYYLSLLQDSGITEIGQLRVSDIFLNNLRAGLLCVVYGFLPYLHLSALPLGVNALLLGLMGAYYVNSGQQLLTYLAGVLPHGIFELPALVFSIAGGLYLCSCVTERLRNKHVGMVRHAVAELGRMFLLCVTPLFLLAATIEILITPWLYAAVQ